MTVRAWASLATAFAAMGCSFFMTTAPADPSERTAEAAAECTKSAELPALDALNAAIGAVNIGISAGADEEVRYYGVTMKKETGLAIGIAELAVFGTAATYGFIQMGRCNALRREVRLDSPPPNPRPSEEAPPPASPTGPTASGQAPAGSDTGSAVSATGPTASAALPAVASSDRTAAPAPAPTSTSHELPSWSALRRFPLTETAPPPKEAPSRYSGSPP